jgi:hypothetical protein
MSKSPLLTSRPAAQDLALSLPRCPWLSRLRALSFAVGLCALAQPALPQSVAAFEHERDIPTSVWRHVPIWRGSLLLVVEDNHTKSPRVDTVNRDGQRESILFDLPDGALVGINAVGAGTDGSIVASITAFSTNDRKVNLVSRVLPDRKSRMLIATGTFMAAAVALAEDGSIWAVGNIWAYGRPDNGDKNVIQHFDTSGTLVSSFKVPDPQGWSVNPANANEGSYLLASQTRIGWFTNGCQYIEFSLDGKEVGRFDGPPGLDWKTLFNVALSARGDLVLSSPKTKVLALDRETRQWVALSLPNPIGQVSRPVGVLGFDGLTLVVEPANGTLRRFRPVTSRSGN